MALNAGPGMEYVPINLTRSSMFPSCLTDNTTCSTQIPRLYDNDTGSNGASAAGINPRVQLALATASIVQAIRITARGDTNLGHSQDLTVYVSTSTAFMGPGGALCASNIIFGALGEVQTRFCHWGRATNYVTVHRSTTSNDHLNLAEVTVLIGACKRRPCDVGRQASRGDGWIDRQ